MEEDEIEMTREELQTWIRAKVKDDEVISPDVLEKCSLLQSLLERREKQAVQLLKLSKSVAACEAIVKKQYSLLGWEYEDTDLDDDDGENTPPSPCETEVPISPTANGHAPLIPKLVDIGNLYRYNGKEIFVNLNKRPVVVLTRLPPSSLRSPSPQNLDSEDESLNSLDSDTQWEPDEDSNDSDYSISSFNSGSNKRRKIDEKFTKSRATRQACTNNGAKSKATTTSAPQADVKSNATKPSTPQADVKSNATKTSTAQADVKSNATKTSTAQADVKSNATKTSTPQADVKSNATKTSTPQADVKSNATKTSTPQADVKSNATKTSTPQADVKSNATKTSTPQADVKSNATKTSTPQADVKSNATKTSTSQASAKSNTVKTTTPPANIKGVTPVGTISALCQAPNKATKTHSRPSASHGKISVNMNVVARRNAMNWRQGKIIEIVTKDAKLKYKISFEELGNILVSGHHIAFDCMPKVDQLFVGARVVVKIKGENGRFSPGIVAEVPSRKNRMRFLVFLDDLTPVYVGLPLLYQVCRPLTDPLDDIPDEANKSFMKEYIESWPYPPQTQYRIGQVINAKLDGAQRRCEVRVVDCSLIEVVFQADQQKEWLYRGSLRLEHMINMREHLEAKKEEGQKKKSITVNED